VHEEDHEVQGIQAWHSGCEGNSHENSSQNLTVSDLKDELRTGVEIFVFTLDDGGGILGVQR
jgi:hypothetical protein